MEVEMRVSEFIGARAEIADAEAAGQRSAARPYYIAEISRSTGQPRQGKAASGRAPWGQLTKRENSYANKIANQ